MLVRRQVLSSSDGGDEFEEYLEGFKNIVDATGTYGQPNWMGKGGTPALGERKMRRNNRIFTTQPVNAKNKDIFQVRLILLNNLFNNIQD